MTYGLTRRQRDLLAYLRSHIAANGQAPSYAEMAAAIGLKSKSSVVQLVRGLAERGHLSFLKNRARSISLADPEMARPRVTIEISKAGTFYRALQVGGVIVDIVRV